MNNEESSNPCQYLCRISHKRMQKNIRQLFPLYDSTKTCPEEDIPLANCVVRLY